MLNDILAEDNKVFSQENYSYNPPAKMPEPTGQVSQPLMRRDPDPYNKENGMMNQGSRPQSQGYRPNKRFNYNSYNNRQQYAPKRRDTPLFPHPEGIYTESPQVHFCEKKGRDMLSPNPVLRKEALHIFGVDFFSEKEISDFFGEFNPVKIEWINDSSCNLIFTTHDDASNGLFAKSEVIEGSDHDLDWRKSLDIDKDGKQFNFMIRPCTLEDIKDPNTKGTYSKYYKYSRQQSSRFQKNNSGIQKGIRKPQRPGNEHEQRVGQTYTLMDKKKSFGRKVIRNKIEVMNQFPGGGDLGYDQAYLRQGEEEYPIDYQQQQHMLPHHNHQINPMPNQSLGSQSNQPQHLKLQHPQQSSNQSLNNHQQMQAPLTQQAPIASTMQSKQGSFQGNPHTQPKVVNQQLHSVVTNTHNPSLMTRNPLNTFNQ